MSSSAPDRTFEVRMIPIALIDPPEVAMRRSMDDEKLQALAASIRESGLRQPIGVRQVGDRYRVSYGHRRRVACELAGETLIPCHPIADDDDEEERAKVDENWWREETNPAEEAIYFKHQLEKRYDNDIERMCRALGVKESRINGRLDLLRGYEDVFTALQNKHISLAVAKELNRIHNELYRRLVLSDAIADGSTANAVATRRINIERQLALNAESANGNPDAAPASTEVPINSVDRCTMCGSSKDTHEMVYVRAHKSCLQVAERARE